MIIGTSTPPSLQSLPLKCVHHRYDLPCICTFKRIQGHLSIISTTLGTSCDQKNPCPYFSSQSCLKEASIGGLWLAHQAQLTCLKVHINGESLYFYASTMLWITKTACTVVSAMHCSLCDDYIFPLLWGGSGLVGMRGSLISNTSISSWQK